MVSAIRVLIRLCAASQAFRGVIAGVFRGRLRAYDRRTIVATLAATARFFSTRQMLRGQPAADDSLRSEIRLNASLLGLPGFVAGVVRNGKLSFVEAEGFADLESQTPMRQDGIVTAVRCGPWMSATQSISRLPISERDHLPVRVAVL